MSTCGSRRWRTREASGRSRRDRRDVYNPAHLCDHLHKITGASWDATARRNAVATQPVELKRTYCRVCMVHCGLVAEVAGDRILKVRGDRDHPLTKGYTCPKGRATGQLHHLDGAITRPMM